MEQRRAFKASKKKLLYSGFLTHYDLEKRVKVKCDASPYGIEACLSHVMDDESVQPVAFASRTLSPTEQNYAQIDREGLALIFGVRYFHKYLVGK